MRAAPRRLPTGRLSHECMHGATILPGIAVSPCRCSIGTFPHRHNHRRRGSKMSSIGKASMSVQTANEASRRAGTLLAAAYPGRHKDKRIAADLGCSPAMAKLLRAGRGWTIRRLTQCAERLGLLFIRDVFAPPLTPRQLDTWQEEIERRIKALETSRGDYGDDLATGALGPMRPPDGASHPSLSPSASRDRPPRPPSTRAARPLLAGTRPGTGG